MCGARYDSDQSKVDIDEDPVQVRGCLDIALRSSSLLNTSVILRLKIVVVQSRFVQLAVLCLVHVGISWHLSTLFVGTRGAMGMRRLGLWLRTLLLFVAHDILCSEKQDVKVVPLWLREVEKSGCMRASAELSRRAAFLWY